MINATRRLLALVLLGLMMGGAHSSVQAQDANAVIQRLKKKYDGIQTLRAEFRQTLRSEFSDQEETFSGTLTLKGEQYRVETPQQTLVTNGRVTWVYLPGQAQVVINDYSEDETSFNINDFFFHYEDRYKVSSVKAQQRGGTKHHVLTLTPRSGESFYTSVTLYMRDADAVITRMEVEDVNGTKMEFDLTNIEINPTIDAATFTFRPPGGTEVVDLRS